MSRAAGKILRGQRQQMVFFLKPSFPDTLGLSFHCPRIVGQTFFQQKRVQFLERGYFRDGYQEIAASIPHAVLHPTFFMTLPRCTKMALEQIVAAECQEPGLFLPLVSDQDVFHCRFQIVVADATWNPFKEPEGLDLRFEERFHFLVGKGHHEYSPGVAQPQGEQLHRERCLVHHDQSFTPIGLGIGPWLVLQRQIHGWCLVLAPPCPNIAAYAWLTAGVAFAADDFVDLVAGIPLLAWHVLGFGQQRLDALLIWPPPWRFSRVFLRIAAWPSTRPRLFHRFPAVHLLARDLPDTFLFDVMCPSYFFVGFHR